MVEVVLEEMEGARGERRIAEVVVVRERARRGGNEWPGAGG